jgi:hypothetical protein
MVAVFPADTHTYVTTHCPNSKDHNVNLKCLTITVAFRSLPLEQKVTSELLGQRAVCAALLCFDAFSKTFQS